MSEQKNCDLVKQGYAAFMHRDIRTLLDLLDDDLDFQHPMPQSIWPWAGQRKGRQGFADFINGLSQAIELEQFEPREFIAQGDYVTVLVFEHGRVKATGVAFDNSYVHVFRFRDGKVVQFLIFEDTAPIIAALQGYRK